MSEGTDFTPEGWDFLLRSDLFNFLTTRFSSVRNGQHSPVEIREGVPISRAINCPQAWTIMWYADSFVESGCIHFTVVFNHFFFSPIRILRPLTVEEREEIYDNIDHRIKWIQTHWYRFLPLFARPAEGGEPRAEYITKPQCIWNALIQMTKVICLKGDWNLKSYLDNITELQTEENTFCKKEYLFF